MYIGDVIGGRVSLLLLRSVCVAKAGVGVAGECLVRPELTFEYLTTGTSGRCLNLCSIEPNRPNCSEVARVSTANRTLKSSCETSSQESDWEWHRTILDEILSDPACSPIPGTALGRRDS